jgi:hypothetical protein
MNIHFHRNMYLNLKKKKLYYRVANIHFLYILPSRNFKLSIFVIFLSTVVGVVLVLTLLSNKDCVEPIGDPARILKFLTFF